MTVNVKKALQKICDNDILEDELYFVGGTALSFYLNHRISEDIDIISSKTLNHKKIIPSMSVLGAKQLQDENVTALRMAGLFPDEYMIKFVLDNVKLEFFQASRPIQREILKDATFTNFENSKLKILDLKSIAKLKLVALIMRDKSRDLFDFSSILENSVLSNEELIVLFNKIDNKINSVEDIINFINKKEESKDDEAVYLNETNRIDLSFEEIKHRAVELLQ
ncbi:nucleotidyl transferase AbiEii/AbiGii toxin family protein [Sulfurimonas sp. NW15]|uniref:nucleotidyl transferase AbiEii/AbiGii toxin family protein n=1 Tax=Sulfurimonas sp. NW15 TaxID=2922729 RepID=UPI003DA89AA1